MFLMIYFLLNSVNSIEPSPKIKNFKCDAYKLGIHYLQNEIDVGTIWISGLLSISTKSFIGFGYENLNAFRAPRLPSKEFEKKMY